jgi:hypothetical protein
MPQTEGLSGVIMNPPPAGRQRLRLGRTVRISIGLPIILAAVHGLSLTDGGLTHSRLFLAFILVVVIAWIWRCSAGSRGAAAGHESLNVISGLAEADPSVQQIEQKMKAASRGELRDYSGGQPIDWSLCTDECPRC